MSPPAQYSEDLKSYYLRSYGYDINARMAQVPYTPSPAQPLVADLLATLQAPTTSTVLNFGHSPPIEVGVQLSPPCSPPAPPGSPRPPPRPLPTGLPPRHPPPLGHLQVHQDHPQHLPQDRWLHRQPRPGCLRLRGRGEEGDDIPPGVAAATHRALVSRRARCSSPPVGRWCAPWRRCWRPTPPSPPPTSTPPAPPPRWARGGV